MGRRLKIDNAGVVIQKIFPRRNCRLDVEIMKLDTRRKRTDGVPKTELDHDEEDSGGDKKWRKLSR